MCGINQDEYITNITKISSMLMLNGILYMNICKIDEIKPLIQQLNEQYKTNILKQMLLNLDCMCHAPAGMTLSFRCFVEPASAPQIQQQQPQQPQQPDESENIYDVYNNDDNDYDYSCYDYD